MHSIDNGHSLERKRDNWKLIDKYLKESGEPNLKNENIEALIANENNEVVVFVIKLHQELAGKKLPILEGKKIKTDQDNINKSYLLKENGEIELIQKDYENSDKNMEEGQKSLSKQYEFLKL